MPKLTFFPFFFFRENRSSGSRNKCRTRCHGLARAWAIKSLAITSNTFDVTRNSIYSRIRFPHSHEWLQRAFIFPLCAGARSRFFYFGARRSRAEVLSSAEYSSSLPLSFSLPPPFPFLFPAERLRGFYPPKAYSFPLSVSGLVVLLPFRSSW